MCALGVTDAQVCQSTYGACMQRHSAARLALICSVSRMGHTGLRQAARSPVCGCCYSQLRLIQCLQRAARRDGC